ncbi:MAG: peptidylprolyl isomerase [Candidatus Omnitrophica bacterium]|nr:peptidylprolyl isomerase [Candidatus Omnitrophota bacterium]
MEAASAGKGSEIVGEVFGQPVTQAEFDYHFTNATRISRRGRGFDTEEARRAEAWNYLIYMREIGRLGLEVDAAELESELKNLLSEQGLERGSERYRLWVREMFNEDALTFENRLRDVLKIEKYTSAPIDPDVSVTEDEIKQKHLNQQSSFEVEYMMCATPEGAEELRKKMAADPSPWKEAYTAARDKDGQKGASWINTMSIEAMIDLWKIPKDDSYRILDAELGSFIAGQNIYGPCVFRLLSKRVGTVERYDDAKREQLRQALVHQKKHEKRKQYLAALVAGAGVRDYALEKEGGRKKEGGEKRDVGRGTSDVGREMKVEGGEKREEAVAKQTQNETVVVLETNQGAVEIELYPDKAPKTCENFVGLVKKGYYDGIIFHRVIKGFMLQGGDPTGTGRGGESLWGGNFQDEFADGLAFNEAGILAMANAGPHTNRSQFFITTAPTPWLNKKHTIFGKVRAGMDVVRGIENEKTDAQDKPRDEQKIVKAYVK